jgi:chromosome segregation ATPase
MDFEETCRALCRIGNDLEKKKKQRMIDAVVPLGGGLGSNPDKKLKNLRDQVDNYKHDYEVALAEYDKAKKKFEAASRPYVEAKRKYTDELKEQQRRIRENLEIQQSLLKNLEEEIIHID